MGVEQVLRTKINAAVSKHYHMQHAGKLQVLLPSIALCQDNAKPNIMSWRTFSQVPFFVSSAYSVLLKEILWNGCYASIQHVPFNDQLPAYHRLRQAKGLEGLAVMMSHDKRERSEFEP